MSAAVAERLLAHLWPKGDLTTTPQVYALLDGARDRRIIEMIRLSRLEYCCLYGSRLTAAMEPVAPHLVHLTPKAAFMRELLEFGWGRSWGVFIVVPPDCTMQQQRRHFRTLLRVQTEDGRTLIFRFYDPRVLRVYLPTCTSSEADQVFGPIPRILAESPDAAQLMVYRRGTLGVVADSVSLIPPAPETARSVRDDAQSTP